MMVSSHFQNKELSIIRLSGTMASFTVPEFPERASDMSSGMLENPAPASLVADLNHYKVPDSSCPRGPSLIRGSPGAFL